MRSGRGQRRPSPARRRGGRRHFCQGRSLGRARDALWTCATVRGRRRAARRRPTLRSRSCGEVHRLRPGGGAAQNGKSPLIPTCGLSRSRMAWTAPGSISRLNRASNTRPGASKCKNRAQRWCSRDHKTHPRGRGTKLRCPTELNLLQTDAHDASFSFIRRLTSRPTSAVRFSRNH